jgi:PNKP adenylyltransferase domain, ligase domain
VPDDEGRLARPSSWLNVERVALSVVRGRRGLAQPALKVREHEYLRIIYGPEYAEPQNLERLRRLKEAVQGSSAEREKAQRAPLIGQLERPKDLYLIGDISGDRYIFRRQVLQQELEA